MLAGLMVSIDRSGPLGPTRYQNHCWLRLLTPSIVQLNIPALLPTLICASELLLVSVTICPELGKTTAWKAKQRTLEHTPSLPRLKRLIDPITNRLKLNWFYALLYKPFSFREVKPFIPGHREADYRAGDWRRRC